MKNHPTVGVLGATSPTGEALLQKLSAQGRESIAIARQKEKIKDLEHITRRSGDVRDRDSLKKALEGVDIVVGIFGVSGLKNAFRATDLYSEGIKNVLAVMGELDIKRLIMVSSSGVLNAPSGNFVWTYIIRPYCWRMYADFSQMELLITEAPLDWTIVRPPQLVGGEDESYAWKVDALPDGPNKITRKALAQSLVEIIQGDTFSRKRLTIDSYFYEKKGS
ncbi:MAG: NAD(P)H-binding protein [Myxococcales bacterium]|nr:NAD(P)H-binding protein [Myxococcales bacterium]MCB9641512.1 NAD(P)H-binding protein [Myxococcales bacterium]